MATLIGNEVASNTIKRGQVYQATHNGEGQSLPYMNRSFISFSYGGVPIENFNLIATFSSGRLDKNGYSEFDDTVSTYDNLDGQYYWGTHYKANQLSFNLSTDGIDQQKLDEFLHHFRAGESKLLILAEHPNRGIMARVANPPSLSLLPFEHQTTMTISSKSYNITTTEYKGDIQLTFVMDSPHWFSIQNVLGIKDTINGIDRYVDEWINANGMRTSIYKSADALKILYEDGIPLGSMIDHNMLLGNGSFANVELNTTSKTWSVLESVTNWQTLGEGARIQGTLEEGESQDYPAGTYYGTIAGAIIDVDGNGISELTKNQYGYFFYAGTAPAPTEITFSFTPTIASGTTPYVQVPVDLINSPSSTTPYNTFTVESTHKQELRFTTPNFYASYNKAIKLLHDNINTEHSWTEIRELLRDNVRHPVPRAWAVRVLEYCKEKWDDGNGVVNSSDKSNAQTAIQYMKYLICNDEGQPYDVTFTFNSETGLAQGIFKYRKALATSDITTIASSNENAAAWASIHASNRDLITKKEDVGDMLRSNYITIVDRNKPNSNGKVTAWTDASAQTNILNKQNAHRIYHDMNVPLKNISILYKNMYL